MSALPNLFAVDADNFTEAVIEASVAHLVLLDFHAEWCAPCKMLAPLLEQLAEKHPQLRIGKVDTDQNPELAAQFGVRGLPTLLLLRNRQMVDQFVGVPGEAELNAAVAQHMPDANGAGEGEAVNPVDPALEQARALYAAGDTGAAQAAVAARLEADPGDLDARLTLADWQIDAADWDGAEATLAAAEDDLRRAPGYRRSGARLHFAKLADPDQLATLRENPDTSTDSNLQHQLAEQLAAAGEIVPALDTLLDLLRRDRDFADGAARRTMLLIFDLCGAQSEVVSHYRAELTRLLY